MSLSHGTWQEEKAQRSLLQEHIRTITDVVRKLNRDIMVPSTRNRRPIARPLGRGMGCLLWVQLMTNTQSYSAVYCEFIFSPTFNSYSVLFYIKSTYNGSTTPLSGRAMVYLRGVASLSTTAWIIICKQNFLNENIAIPLKTPHKLNNANVTTAFNSPNDNTVISLAAFR